MLASAVSELRRRRAGGQSRGRGWLALAALAFTASKPPRAPRRRRPRHTRWLAPAALAALAGCAGLQVQPLPEPIRPPKVVPESTETQTAQASGRQTDIAPAPGVVIQRSVAEGIADRLGEDLTGDAIAVSFNDVPLATFINEVFAERLGLSFSISPDLREQADLVTLRLTEPVPPAQLFATARRVLQDYGVGLQASDGLVRFVSDEEAAATDVPLLISGRTLPAVPATHRVVFQLVPLAAQRVPNVFGVVRQAFPDGLGMDELPQFNAILLRGTPAMVSRAADMIEVLDQPMLRGRHGIIIEPAYLEAQALAKDLTAVLEAEGYEVTEGTSSGAVIVLALESVEKVVAFAADRAILDHIKEWARRMDAKEEAAVEDAVFTYQVRHTEAESMTETLNQILFGASADGRELAAGEAADAAPASSVGGIGDRAGGIVVDKNRNMLLFRGAGREWAKLRSVIEQLDRPVPSVLIEVLIAEITLNDEQDSGMDFLFRNGIGGDRGISTNTRDALGLMSRGLSLTLDSAGVTRAVLNLFYENSRVAIRSASRLMVKSGETATFDAGNEIPTVTQTADSGTQTGGSTNFLQQVTYRRTGVVLEIQPVVQADGLVELGISQELSEARPSAATSLTGTPTILSRRIATNLTLRDGGSLLMGGLVSNNQSFGETGVPGLARVPGLGRLFRRDTLNADRTELVILVIPYVVADHREGWELTERIKAELELHKEFME